jgi:hypothetical protein
VVAGDDERATSVLLDGHSSIMLDIFTKDSIDAIDIGPEDAEIELEGILDAQVVDGIVTISEQSGDERNFEVAARAFKFGSTVEEENFRNFENRVSEGFAASN